jgi:hypothetical protein
VLGERDGGVLTAGVGVADQLARHDGVAVAVALPQRHPQRDVDQVDVLGGRGVPGDDLLGEHVEDERDVDEPGPGAARR